MNKEIFFYIHFKKKGKNLVSGFGWFWTLQANGIKGHFLLQGLGFQKPLSIVIITCIIKKTKKVFKYFWIKKKYFFCNLLHPCFSECTLTYRLGQTSRQLNVQCSWDPAAFNTEVRLPRTCTHTHTHSSGKWCAIKWMWMWPGSHKNLEEEEVGGIRSQRTRVSS